MSRRKTLDERKADVCAVWRAATGRRTISAAMEANGELEVGRLSNLSQDETIELKARSGVLMGVGVDGEDGMEAGVVAGSERAAPGVSRPWPQLSSNAPMQPPSIRPSTTRAGWRSR